MRLSLSFPSSWDIKEAPGSRFMAILAGESKNKPQGLITWGPIILRPDELRPFMEQTMCSEIPAGTRVQINRTTNHQTSAGWPVCLVEAELLTNKGELVECRIGAFYVFLEHAAVAMVRFEGRTQLDANSKALMTIIESGRPEWRDQLRCLADLWDLQTTKDHAPTRLRTPPVSAGQSDHAAAEALKQIEQAIVEHPTPQGHVRRGDLLLSLRRPAEALAAFQAASALDAGSLAAHYFAGVALGELGQHEAAIGEWEQALKLDPNLGDAHYNIAQARWNLKQFGLALDAFTRAATLNPTDFQIARKEIQCLYALGRYDEGLAARTRFRERWSQSRSAARLMEEYVFDQFAGPGFRVHAVETLRPRNPAIYSVIYFRAVDERDRSLPATVLIETSDQAKQAGTPFVLGVDAAGQFKVIGASPQLPAYQELKSTVLRLLSEALKM